MKLFNILNEWWNQNSNDDVSLDIFSVVPSSVPGHRFLSVNFFPRVI